MHERTLPILAGPVVARSWLFLVNDKARLAEQAALDQLLGTTGEERWYAHVQHERGGFLYERHGEFSTWLCYQTGLEGRGDETYLGFNSISESDFPWLRAAHGEVFRSVEIVVRPYEPTSDSLCTVMDLPRAVSCDVFDGAARIWSDFRLHEGCGRIFVYDRGLKNDETARLLQTLIEIGNYRKLALLGFPVARELLGWLKPAEQTLIAITEDMASAYADQGLILDRIMALSAEVEARINAVRFRQGATEAYARLTRDRLHTLNEGRVPGFSTMQEFIERRMEPAMRTCEAATLRLDDLALRIGRAGDLLRARISISLEVQNQDLLKSMNVRAKLQMKLSTLVEGLSVFAVTYYAFSLLKYGMDALLPKKVSHLLYAPAILLLLGAVWWFIHHQKKHLTGKQTSVEER